MKTQISFAYSFIIFFSVNYLHFHSTISLYTSQFTRYTTRSVHHMKFTICTSVKGVWHTHLVTYQSCKYSQDIISYLAPGDMPVLQIFSTYYFISCTHFKIRCTLYGWSKKEAKMNVILDLTRKMNIKMAKIRIKTRASRQNFLHLPMWQLRNFISAKGVTNWSRICIYNFCTNLHMWQKWICSIRVLMYSLPLDFMASLVILFFFASQVTSLNVSVTPLENFCVVFTSWHRHGPPPSSHIRWPCAVSASRTKRNQNTEKKGCRQSIIWKGSM